MTLSYLCCTVLLLVLWTEVSSLSLTNDECRRPNIKNCAEISPWFTTIPNSSSYFVKCRDGFTLRGSAVMTCTEGSLSTAPKCVPHDIDWYLNNFNWV